MKEIRELVKIDRNGTKYWSVRTDCIKCGGRGIYTWGGTVNGVAMYSGTCFRCGGSGRETVIEKEYTPEHAEKLEAQRAKRAAARAEKYAKAEAERAAERARREAEEQARKAISQHIGEVGKRIQIDVTLEKAVSFEVKAYGGFGTTMMCIYIFKDESGNKLTWKTGACLERVVNGEYIPVQEGEKVAISGTVKAHGAYKGEKQTELQRVKLIA